jgi:hypothetical protein
MYSLLRVRQRLIDAYAVTIQDCTKFKVEPSPVLVTHMMYMARLLQFLLWA